MGTMTRHGIAATRVRRVRRRLRRLPLPPPLIALNSTLGEQILKQEQTLDGAFVALTIHLTTQANPGYCAVAAATTILNAMGGDPADGQAYVNQTSFFTENTCSRVAALHFAPYTFADPANETVPDEDEVVRHLGHHGSSLSQAGRYLRCHGLSARVVHADSIDEDEFSNDLIRALLAAPASFVLVDFQRGALGLAGHAHFSPIGR